MLNFIKGLFGVDKVLDTGLRIIEKVAGTDEMTSKEKAAFILDYQKATMHQSPARRFIALCILSIWSFVVLTWLFLLVLGSLLSFEEAVSASEAVLLFLENVILQPMNLIIGFYFGVGVVNSMRKQ